MEERYYQMSQKTLDRATILEKVKCGKISQVEAGLQLGLGKRQMIRVYQLYLKNGAKGLRSQRLGKPSNNKTPEELKQKALSLIKTHYYDFGPTLAREKLVEKHSLKLSIENLRQLMIKEGLWKGKRRHKITVHQMRERRACFGELIQIDGSPHAWFEDRGEACCLLVLIDDATGRLVGLRFEAVESAEGYFRVIKGYLKRFGRPLSFYSDRHGIFNINAKEAISGSGITQFKRAMNELGIELICANTPQAKGRVERVNKTLQDRLVKELRLQGINDIDTANAFLPEFIEDFNKRFAVEAKSAMDVHRPTVPDEKVLDFIMTFQHQRTLSKNLELSFDGKIYQIQTDGYGYTMRRAKVTVYVRNNEVIGIVYKNQFLNYKTREKACKSNTIASSKEVNIVVDYLKTNDREKGHKPKSTHPWARYNAHWLNSKSNVTALTTPIAIIPR